MTAVDATRLAGDAYSTRLARDVSATTDDKTRLVQEGYESKLARDAVGVQPDADEFYKIGDKIGDRYEVAAIHHGAMGVVYGCFDHETKLPRALKSVRARYANDKQVLALFESEATVWISLEKHPYIVRAYLVERFKNLPYVITEYVRGPAGMEGDLRGWLGHPRLTLSVAVAMALQIAQGMQHAVRKVPSLVHRDLKPANILVNGDGKAMVTDFGLVHATQSSAGTPAYMSPEQWRDEALDARSDIYAYGCILFEVLTAHRLFPAKSEQEWEHAHLEIAPTALTTLVPELPGQIDLFVRRCLSKDTATRPQTWDEVVTFFAEWYHVLTGNAVVLDFSSFALDAVEWVTASYSLSVIKRYEEQLLACNQALSINPNDAITWCSKGAAFRNLKRYEEAIQTCEMALSIDRNFAFAWYMKGVSLSDLSRHEEALQAHEQSLTLNPDNPNCWFNNGNVLWELKRHSEALHAYERAIALNPDDPNIWFNNGNVLGELKRHSEALQAYERALALNPDDPNIWFRMGLVLLHLERYVEALTAYDRASPLDSKGGVSFAKGFALQKLNRYEESICACDRALALNPSLSIAQSTRSFSLQKLEHSHTPSVRSPQTLWARFWDKLS